MFVIDARVFLQYIGGIWKQVFYDGIWADLCINAVKKEKGNVVISDFRYPSEYTSMDNKFDNITSIKVLGKNLYETDKYDNHSSETSLNDFKFDYHINNTIWSDASLTCQIKALLAEVQGE